MVHQALAVVQQPHALEETKPRQAYPVVQQPHTLGGGTSAGVRDCTLGVLAGFLRRLKLLTMRMQLNHAKCNSQDAARCYLSERTHIPYFVHALLPMSHLTQHQHHHRSQMSEPQHHHRFLPSAQRCQPLVTFPAPLHLLAKHSRLHQRKNHSVMHQRTTSPHQLEEELEHAMLDHRTTSPHQLEEELAHLMLDHRTTSSPHQTTVPHKFQEPRTTSPHQLEEELQHALLDRRTASPHQLQEELQHAMLDHRTTRRLHQLKEEFEYCLHQQALATNQQRTVAHNPSHPFHIRPQTANEKTLRHDPKIWRSTAWLMSHDHLHLDDHLVLHLVLAL